MPVLTFSLASRLWMPMSKNERKRAQEEGRGRGMGQAGHEGKVQTRTVG